MEDAVGMAETDAAEDLLHEGFHHRLRQSDTLVDVVAGLILVHEGFEIVRHELKHQIQPTRLGLDDIQELHDVRVVQLTEERDFANDVAGDTALWSLVGKGNALDGNLLVGCSSIATIDHAVCALADHLGSDYSTCDERVEKERKERSEGSCLVQKIGMICATKANLFVKHANINLDKQKNSSHLS